MLVTPERDEVRRAFARIATNVAVVTAPGPAGCTANVWAEAHDPPVLLVTLERHSRTHDRVVAGGRFAVNVLSADQAAVARRFAGPRERRFDDAELDPEALPVLDGALATFECAVQGVHWFGAFDILVGDVRSLSARQDGRPLLYADRRFCAPEELR